MFSFFETSTPQLYLDIDRTKAQMLGVRVPDVFAALQIYIGSSYVNDFNLFGRTYRVTAQADSGYRLEPSDVLNIRVRNDQGQTVPLASFTTVRDMSGPVSRAALQSLSRGRTRWRRGARLFARPGDRRHGADRGARRCRTASPTNGRRWRSSRTGPATPRSSPSCWRWCSCSWCWRRNTRA